MKKLTTEIKNKDGNVRTISVYVDDKTAAALKCCDEEIRRLYILEEYKEFNRTRSETRRHDSLDELFEKLGNLPCSDEESLEDWAFRREEYRKLHKAMESLTDKQYTVLWLAAVDKLSFHKIGEKMGIYWGTARRHYNNATKKLKKFFEK